MDWAGMKIIAGNERSMPVVAPVSDSQLQNSPIRLSESEVQGGGGPSGEASKAAVAEAVAAVPGGRGPEIARRG